MLKWLGKLWKTKKRRDNRRPQARWKAVFDDEHQNRPIYQGLGAYQRNLDFFQNACGSSHDMIFRRIRAGKDEVTLIYVDGLNNKQLLEQDVVDRVFRRDAEIGQRIDGRGNQKLRRSEAGTGAAAQRRGAGGLRSAALAVGAGYAYAADPQRG